MDLKNARNHTAYLSEMHSNALAITIPEIFGQMRPLLVVLVIGSPWLVCVAFTALQ